MYIIYYVLVRLTTSVFFRLTKEGSCDKTCCHSTNCWQLRPLRSWTAGLSRSHWKRLCPQIPSLDQWQVLIHPVAG